MSLLDVFFFYNKFLSLLTTFSGCLDEDKRVIENIELAAEYMGYFVCPNVICNLVMPTLSDPTVGHLKVFAAMLRGSPRETLTPELSRIGQFLQDCNICRNRKTNYQIEILSCCRSLLIVCKEDCSMIAHDLFTAIFTVLAASNESSVEESAKSLLGLLTKALNFESLNELFDNHVKLTLISIQHEPEAWIMDSYDFLIFQACLKHAKLTTHKHLDLIHPIFERTVHVDGDKKVRLKQYILLSDYLQQWEKPLKETTGKGFIDFANVILEKMIIPGLTWTAGRSAEAIRTASVCCLCAMLSKILNNCENKDVKGQENLPISIKHFGWLFEKVRPILLSLFEDDSYKTRLYSLQAVCLVINIGQELSYITEEHIHKLSPEILSRLEDQHDEVRLAAIEAIREIWKVLPKDYDLSFYYVHIEYVYKNILTHLDDPREKFQSQTLGKQLY